MDKIFILNGYPRSGKDYLIDSIDSEYSIKCGRFSTVDLVKKMMEIIGYVESDKDIKDAFRPVLSDTKDSIDKHLNNLTLKNAYERAKDFIKCDLPAFIFSREPHNIKNLVEMGKADGIEVVTVLVESDENSKFEAKCHADDNVNNYQYDYKFTSTRDSKKYKDNLKKFIKDNYININVKSEDFNTIETLDLTTNPNTMIIYTGKNGTDSDKIHASKYLEVGEHYSLESISVGSWSSEIQLHGVGKDGISLKNKFFNSVHFKNIKDE